MGADVGARVNGRTAYVGENYNTAIQYGHLLTDGLCDWLSKGLALGLYSQDNIPFANYRVSPMSVVPKPSGAGRIYFDLSSPHTSDMVEAVAEG